MFCCGGRPPCIFCHVSKERGFLVVYEDGDLIAFHDRSPAAQLHLLVITKRHIGTVKNLDSSDVDLLQKMVQRGELLLKEHGFDADSGHQVRLGFHVPPFNSVDHLHMHVIAAPFKNIYRRWKYDPVTPWYTDAKRVLDRLKRGEKPV